MSTAIQRTYRLYALDAARRIVSGDWLNAVDDADAVALAEAQGLSFECEIWEGRRMVAQLEGPPLQG